MEAIVYDPSVACGLRIGEAPDPRSGPHQALVQVHAIAINFADVAYLADRVKPGDVVGFEASGTVVRAAEDGSGPVAGSSITGFASRGGWAQWRALDVDDLAVVPDSVDLADASATTRRSSPQSWHHRLVYALVIEGIQINELHVVCRLVWNVTNVR